MRIGETPVPIPNTMVKTDAADNTWLETAREDKWLPNLWGYSSVGRAPALQAGGHEFESRYLHADDFLEGHLQENRKGRGNGRKPNGLVAQVVRAHA